MSTIRGRLRALLLTGLAVVLVAGGSAVYWIARSNLLRQFDDGLRQRAITLASLVSHERGRLRLDYGDAGDLIGGTYYEVRNRSGALLKRSGNLAGTELPVRTPKEDEIEIDDVALPHDVKGRAAWYAFVPEVDEDNDPDHDGSSLAIGDGVDVAPEEMVVAVAAIDRNLLDRALATLLVTLCGVGGVVGLTAAGLVTLGVRWGLTPLERLRRQLGGIGGQALATRLDESGAPGELMPVYRELNRMLDRVEHTIERERSFADAAAHELRTPLAELRATAEVAIRWPDSERAASSLREMLEIGREMERLVESLLIISRGSGGVDEDGGAPVSAAALVPGCLERAHGTIREKDLELSIETGDNGVLQGPRDALEIIVRNLVENAVRYTPARGRIEIRSVTSADGTPALVVENGPVELSEEDLPRLFQPFWRTDGARSDREHVGLGLTVVDRIAQAVGLEVAAELAGDRLRIRVSAVS